MAQNEQISDLGYLATNTEATKRTAVVPDRYYPLYTESLTTQFNFNEDKPMLGNRAMLQRLLRGKRTHSGTIEVLAEPDSAAYFFNKFGIAGNITDNDPLFTHPYTFETGGDIKSATMDIAKGDMVYRYFGVEYNSIELVFADNTMHFNLGVVARGAFSVAKLVSSTYSDPTSTLTLNTEYDPSPTDGLVVGDTLQCWDVSEGAFVAVTVASIPSGTTITHTGDVSALDAGDWLVIKPQSDPTFTTLQTPFEWGRTEFCFGVDAATATSATHTPVEPDSSIKLLNNVEGDTGDVSSGNLDPRRLPRTNYGAEISIKKFKDDPQEQGRLAALDTRALVVRSYSGSGHELRLTFNEITQSEAPVNIEVGGILYENIKYAPSYNVTDGQLMDVKVINSLSTLS